MIWFVALISVLLVAGLWAAALLLTWPLWIPAAFTVLTVVGLSVFFLVRFLRAKQRAAALEAELRRQNKSSGDRASGPTEAEQEIQGRIRELAGVLRRGQFKNRWSDSALYGTPWYLVLGPPSSGKSTALQTSGLGLRASGGRQPKTKVVVATKGCQPWVCDGGVLIDTAGRYALGDGEDNEWGTLVTALRRTRRQKPLDGVVLTYSVSDLISDRPEQLEEKAKRLRAVLEDLCARLGSVLPIYLVLTKMDQLPGFSEFYSDVGGDAGERIWGATLEAGRGEAVDAAESFKTEFDLMKQAMHAYFLARLPSQQRTPEASAKALRFPVELEAARGPLARLVEEVFRPSSYQETPLLRGFYFTSSGASGADFEAAPAGGFKGGAGTQFAVHTSYQAPTASRSLFLGQLFPRVVFPDRHFATRSRRSVALERRQQLLLGIGALGLFFFGILPPTLSCIANFNLIDDSRDDARRARQLASSQGVTGVVSESLDLLVERYLALQAETERFSLSHFWGPYTAEPLRDALRVRYLDQLRAIVHGPLRDRVSDSIRVAADQRGLDPTSFEGAYKDLQLYLMLAHPERLDPQFASSELAKSWLRASGRQLGANAPAVDSHVQAYLQILAKDPTWAWPEDAGLVARTRAQLAQMPVEDIKYSVLEQAAANAPPILPEHIFVGESARYVTTNGKVEVPGLYTALGWSKVKPYLKPDQAVEFAPWVLAEQGGTAPQWGVEALRKLYFDRYTRAWMDFLVGLDVNTPKDLKSAIDELSALNKGEGPYVRLFRRLSENVRLELEPVSLKDQALAKLDQKADQVAAQATGGAPPPPPPERRVSPVEQSFRRLLRFGFGDAAPGAELPMGGLSQYLDQLRSLEVSLRQLQELQVEATNEFGNEMSKAASNIERLLTGFDQTERLALEPLLLNPIRGSQKIVEAKGREALINRWRVEVYEPFKRLANRYPFVLSSGSDVPMPDFAEFFRPQSGTLWRYFEENLAARFIRAGNGYAVKPSEAKTNFRSDFLQCLATAQLISDAVFVDGAQQPAVPFKVKMQSTDPRISQTILKIDGETLTYGNEPEKWRAMTWPSKEGASPGASLQVKGADFEALVRREDGDFGFLRLLAAGDVKPVTPGSTTLEASWRFSLQGKESRVNIQFQAPRSRHPFLPGFFSKLDCPPAIVSAPDRD
jgi:type VI secretion system protein ImpL